MGTKFLSENRILEEPAGGAGGGISIIRVPLVSGTFSVNYTQGTLAVGQTSLDASSWTDGTGVYEWRFAVVLQCSHSTITTQAQLWNVTDNEAVTGCGLTHTGDVLYSAQTSAALTVGAAAGNLKSSTKVYEVRLSVSAGGSTVAHVATIAEAFFQVTRS